MEMVYCGMYTSPVDVIVECGGECLTTAQASERRELACLPQRSVDLPLSERGDRRKIVAKLPVKMHFRLST